MARLLVHVEGPTEETFVNEILGPHLYPFGYEIVSARLVGNARLRAHRGGGRSWDSVRGDIVRHLTTDAGAVSTTMMDFYGLPATGGKEWPGRSAANDKAFPEKAKTVEDALHAEVASSMGAGFDAKRFLPFVLMHEFEGLLFSDCAAFSRGIQRPDLQAPLQAIRNSFATPEEINDSPLTAPSKRILNLIPEYQKPVLGNFAILEIGLAAIRAQCPHFGSWLDRLESLPSQ